jgi:hypothetical protein
MGNQEGVAFMSEQDVPGFDDVTVEELEEVAGGALKGVTCIGNCWGTLGPLPPGA